MTSTLTTTRRLARVRIPERTDNGGVPIGELEDRLRDYSAGKAIDFDLTSASTAAFPPPPYFLEGVAAAIRDGRPGYTALRGDLGVRERLAPRLEALIGVPIDPASEIVLTAGTQSGLFSTLAALVQSGDTILVADPEYLCDERIARFLGAEVRPIPFARRGEQASLDLDAVEQGFRDGARVLIFSNPHNPTGSVMSRASLERLAELVAEHDAYVIADELYARFVYDEEATPLTHMATLPGMRERCVTALGPSKTESASGFRIGVLVGPAAILSDLARVIEITTVRAPAYAQYALEGWLDDDHALVRGMVDRYRALRDQTIARLARVEGVEVASPPATAWLFPDVSGLGRGDEEVVKALIDAGVLVMPGASFGPTGAGCLRMCFGQHEETWGEGLERIADVFDRLRR